LRWLISTSYRQRVSVWLARQWHRLETFAAEAGAIPWSATFTFAMLPAVVLYLSEDRTMGSGDTLPVLAAAASLVNEGNVNLDAFVLGPRQGKLHYFLCRRGDAIYSNYPSGMLTFAVPSAALARLAGADFAVTQPARMDCAVYQVTETDFGTSLVYQRLEKWTAAWLAAGCLGLFFLIALHLVAPTPALVATCLLGCASTLFSTLAQALWQHDGTVFWTLVLLLAEFRHRDRPSRWSVFSQGVACGMLPAIRLLSAVIVVPFAIYLLCRAPRRALLVFLISGLVYAPWAMLYAKMYGNPFGPSSGMLKRDLWFTHFWEGLLGITISPSRGLLVYQPWLILGLAVLIPSIRQRIGRLASHGPAGWVWPCLAAIVLQIVLVAGWASWWGGHCWGTRLLADVIPLAALLCVKPIAALWESNSEQRIVVAVGVLGFCLHYAAVHYRADYWNNTVDPGLPETYQQLWSWSRPPFVRLQGS
jgi:hypothetical protein